MSWQPIWFMAQMLQRQMCVEEVGVELVDLAGNAFFVQHVCDLFEPVFIHFNSVFQRPKCHSIVGVRPSVA